jgi:PAS domain S-box-containing protein
VTDYSIYMLSIEGLVASWNAGAQRIKGYTPEEIIGQHFSRFYTDEDRKKATRSAPLRRPPKRDDARKRVGVSARTKSGSGPMW